MRISSLDRKFESCRSSSLVSPKLYEVDSVKHWLNHAILHRNMLRAIDTK